MIEHLHPFVLRILERRGISADRGNINRNIAEQNSLLRLILERLKVLRVLLKDELTLKAPPTLADTLQRIFDTGEKTVVSLRAIEEVLKFMHDNAVSTLPELREAVTQKQRRSKSINKKLEILQILRKAEEIDRKLYQRTHQRTQKNRERERS
jgi:hypothetical protein